MAILADYVNLFGGNIITINIYMQKLSKIIMACLITRMSDRIVIKSIQKNLENTARL